MTDVDHVLRAQVRHINDLVLRLGEHVTVVSGQVSAVDARQAQTQDALRRLREDFLTFVQETQRANNVQRAETRIGVIKDELEHEFGHHKTVRRTAVGILQAFDIGLVSEQTVRAISEDLMLRTPRYWLAPVLVALASWASDEEDLCGRAVGEAFRRSPGRTSLFFALVLRRQGRTDVAVRWLRHFLNVQDPNRLGREFAVILESAAQGAFGGAGKELVRRRLTSWRGRMLTDGAAAGRQIGRWRAEVESLRTPSADAEFPRLAALSPDWPALDAVLSSARAHERLVEKYRTIMEREPLPEDRIEDAVDDILDRLVSTHDADELPLFRDLALNEAIVAAGGDLAHARSAADRDAAALEETLDYLTLQTTSALTPDSIGVSSATQRMAVAACRPFLSQAHDEFGLAYRGSIPADVRVTFGSSHTIGARTFDLPAWSGSFARPLEELQADLGAHWDAHGRPFVQSLGYQWQGTAAALAGTVLAILFVAGRIDLGFAVVTAVVVGAVWGLVLRIRFRRAAQAQRLAREHLEQAKQVSLRQLAEAAAELTDWHTAFRSAETFSSEARKFIAGLSAAGQAPAPFDSRTVTPPSGAVR
ncbi:hypothetical protein [Streptomyces johnsoniae]|uniref:Uncharacterized protein n=1 Tax=Streptomyces johnsoniae TaxID=3075532 RepID=A0ABU2S8Y2_9ACTN|nr:hypothetical protein [Streptomyces sp. DSM 41886]MDT0445436.1 hypothetical protein [Streptomyces sp. DSM 41886]